MIYGKIWGGGNKYLNKLLVYATSNTEFYRDYYLRENLQDFPIINKNVIRDNVKEMLSNEYSGKSLHSMSTSGSTGNPLTVKQNRNKRNRVLAEIIYFGEQCGYYLGDRNVYLRVWTKEIKKSRLAALKQNMIMLDTSNLGEENLERIRQVLKKDKKITCVLGYATTLDLLSKYMLEKNDDPTMFNLRVIISSAEVLNDITKANLKKVFGCNVVSRYSNQENGIIAQRPIDEDFYVINKASYHLEFLKINSDEEAQVGELARIVITDLFNYAMPIIRYDIGDLAIREKHDKYGEVITSIEGRKNDFLYDTSGNILSPHSLGNNLWGFDEIKQYQLIQEDRAMYKLKINGDVAEQKIISVLKSFLGEDANIAIEYVSGIPSLKSGKFQTTVCKYKP